MSMRVACPRPMPPPCPMHPRHWHMDKRPPRHLHARPLPLQRRYCALLHACALSSLYRCAKPSPPSPPPCAGPHCPHAMRGCKRRTHLHLIRTRAVSASGKPSPPHPPLFSTASSVPSHLTPPLSPYTDPRASPEPNAAPQSEGPTPSPPLSFDAITRTGELCPSIARLPRCELGLSIMSGECTMGWGSLRCTPC
jgi:hypothetical protein